MNHLPENITHELLLAFLSGNATSEESDKILAWMNSSAENKKYVDDLNVIWTESIQIKPTPVSVDADAAWNKLSARIDKAGESDKEVPTRKMNNTKFYKTLLKVAAVLVPLLIVAYLFLFPRKEVKQLAVVTHENTQQQKLADGSLVKINSNSILTYPEEFNGDMREVSLEGEAFFEVNPDKQKPFVIHSGDADIKVVGTSFNVEAYKNKEYVEVYVKTGRVLLYSANQQSADTSRIEIAAGSKGIYNRKTKKAYIEKIASENDLFWMTKTLVFNKTELSEVVKILNKNYPVTITLKNKKLNSLRLSATFKDQSIDSIVDIILTSFNLTVTKTKSTYEIDGEGN